MEREPSFPSSKLSIRFHVKPSHSERRARDRCNPSRWRRTMKNIEKAEKSTDLHRSPIRHLLPAQVRPPLNADLFDH